MCCSRMDTWNNWSVGPRVSQVAVFGRLVHPPEEAVVAEVAAVVRAAGVVHHRPVVEAAEVELAVAVEAAMAAAHLVVAEETGADPLVGDSVQFLAAHPQEVSRWPAGRVPRAPRACPQLRQVAVPDLRLVAMVRVVDRRVVARPPVAAGCSRRLKAHWGRGLLLKARQPRIHGYRPRGQSRGRKIW